MFLTSECILCHPTFEKHVLTKIKTILLFVYCRSSSNEIVYESKEKTSKLYLEIVKAKVQTMNDAWLFCVKK